MITIEKGIPAPTAPQRGNKKYPFAEMDIGDSILIPVGSREIGNAANAAHYYAKRNDKRFTSKLEEAGLRIWRLK